MMVKLKEVKWMTSIGEVYTVLRADFDDGHSKHIAIVNYDSLYQSEIK